MSGLKGKFIRKINNKQLLIFITMAILCMGNSKYLIVKGINSYVEYAGYFLLMCGIAYYFLKKQNECKLRLVHIIFGVVVILFSIGIIVQPLSVSVKVRLVLTMITIASAAIIAENYINSFADIRAASYGVLAGMTGAMLLSVANRVSLFDNVNEGILHIGFNGGLEYKNYFAGSVLASFMGISLVYKYGQETQCNKKYKDLFILLLETVLILLSSSRGGYILFAVFLAVINFDKLRVLRRNKFLEAICFVIIILAGIWFFYAYVLGSDTYLYRIRGVLNYFEYHKSDWFHLLFGNAEMAYEGGGMSYVDNIRATVGWNGTYEMGFINAMIKNGILGIIGYFIIFVYIIFVCIKCGSGKQRTVCFSVLVTLLVSSLVESYVCNIHTIFGIYCYMVMSGLCGMMKEVYKSRQEISLEPEGLL